MLMVGLAFVVFELTAESSLAVVLGCAKFGTPDLKIARWLRRADPDRVRGYACSWFYIVLAIMRIGIVALLVMIVLIAVGGPGIPQGLLERQAISALLVLFACFVTTAVTSWVAVASALRGSVHPWMDATSKSAAKHGLWPPLVPERSRRADLGPGLIVAYAVLTGWNAILAQVVIASGVATGKDFATIMLWIVFATLGSVLGFFLTPSVMWKIEAQSALECYPEISIRSNELA
jgi:hypothetical protein